MLNWEDIREEDIERGSKEGRDSVKFPSSDSNSQPSLVVLFNPIGGAGV
jgi:hypothetical protein